jgi:hypothetical protein
MRVLLNATSLRRKTLQRQPTACQEIVRISCALDVINWQSMTLGLINSMAGPYGRCAGGCCASYQSC